MNTDQNKHSSPNIGPPIGLPEQRIGFASRPPIRVSPCSSCFSAGWLHHSLTLLVMCASAAAQPGLVKTEFIYETAPFPECHASTLAETKAGLVAAWFGGTRERHPDVG